MTVLPLASLRSRLFLVVVAAITPFVLYAALDVARGKSVAGNTLRSDTQARARSTARSLDARMLTVDQLLDSGMVQVRLPARSRRPLTLQDSAENPLAGGMTIAVLDSTGNRKATLLGAGALVDAIPPIRRTSLTTTALASARQTRATAPATLVDEGGARNESDSAAMIIVRPIKREGPRCDCLADAPAVLVAVLSDRAVQRMLGSDTLPSGAMAALTGTTGSLLGRPLAPERWNERDAHDTMLVAAATDREGVIQMQGQDDVARSVGFATLKRLPWRVYVGVPVSSVAAATNQQLRDALMLAVLALGIAAIGVVIASRAFSGPLQTLVADTKRLAAGALSHRTEVAGASGELGALGTAMNALAADLETRRRQLQDELRKATQVFDDSPVPIWVADASTDGPTAGRIQQANAAAARLFNVAEGSLIGLRDSELLDAAGIALLAAPDATSDESVPSARSGRTAIRSSDGRVRACQLHVSHVLNLRQPMRIVTALDATAEPLAAVPAPAANTALPAVPTPDAAAQPDGSDAVVAFAGRVSEDFTDLLRGIVGFTQLALESADDPDMRAIAVQRIGDLALRGVQMTSQVAAFGQRDLLDLQDVDANEVLAESLQSMAGLLGRDVELDVRHNLSPAVVRADAQLLGQVVTSLLQNARDAMPAGGTLTLATTLVDVPAESRDAHYAAPEGRYIVLTVADTGMGMTPDAQRHMFEPFWSTKEHQGPGVGLGLAAVSGIVREHGWVIAVESEASVGTAISIYMPAVEDTFSPTTDEHDAQTQDQSTLETVPSRSE